ncbi:MAG: glycosyltransferase, partial [Flavobacteriaceae bacterium]
ETEIIVALSRSNKGCEKLNTMTQIHFLKCSGTGRALQMNEAVSVSTGDILVFLHADVIPPKSFLTDIKEAIQDTYDAGFFSYRFDKENFFLKINASFTAKDGIFTGGGDQCLFIKKATFHELGSFDEEQVVMEDFEFFKRMKKNKIRYKIIKNDLIVSARKYQYNSYIRVNFSNLLLVFLFKLGYPSAKLKTLHDRLIKTPYQNRS